MSDDQTVTFYLHPKLRRQAQAGNHNFIGKIINVLQQAGLRVDFDSEDDVARVRAMMRDGYSLFLMQEPVNDRGLVFRKTYLYPFWHIEKQGKRWEWPVAKAHFDPAAVDPRKAANFQRFWRKRLFKDPAHIRQDGYVYVPLQGRLLIQRSFQSCSPLEMIEAVLEQDPHRRVMVTLHPSELYDVEEQHALEDLLDRSDRLYMQTGGSEELLQNCDYIVTQNSSVGFMGYFFDKPLILFGKADFHHIARNVDSLSVRDAFEGIMDHRPGYAAYLFWFLQEQAINAGRAEVTGKIRKVLRAHGWPV